MRLRVGLWYQYHRSTRAGEFDPLPRNPYTRGKLLEALMPEATKYDFVHRDTGASLPASCALTYAVDFLWSQPKLGCNAAGEPVAVYTISALAEYLVRTFKVTLVDRRKADRRLASAATT
jgi:hypothetical protein